MNAMVYLAAILVAAAPRAPGPAMESLAWLSGCWAAGGGEPGSGEFWAPLAGDSLLGVSRTVRDGRTVAHEFLQIRPGADGAIVLTALPSGQAETAFPLVSLEGHTAVFENREHDFPQRIVYKLEESDRLAAWIEGTVSGQARRIDFPMNRIDCNPAGPDEKEE